MELKYIQICLFVLQIEDIHLSLYYSGTVRHSHYDASEICESFGGKLLEYGMDFVNASLQCEQNVYIWAGTPFYDQLRGCFKGNSSRQTAPDMRQEDKRVAICADYCANEEYTHFGLMTSECHCYNQGDFINLDQSNTCQIPSCPGNLYDICGVSPWAMVFEKVYQVEILSCQARDIRDAGESHEFTGYCYNTQPFWCRVGNSNEVSCSLPQLQSTTESEHILFSSTTDSFLGLSTPTAALWLSSIISTSQAKNSFYTSITDTEPSYTTATTETGLSSPSSKITEQTSTIRSTFTEELTPSTSPTKTIIQSTAEGGTQTNVSLQTTTKVFRTTDVSFISSQTMSTYLTREIFAPMNTLQYLSTQESEATTDTSTFGVSNEASTTEVSTEDAADKMSQISTENTSQATIIGVTTAGVIVLIIIIVIIVIVVRIRRKKTKPKSPKHAYPIPDVFFTNTINGEPNIDHNSIRFRNSGDFVRSIPFKTKEPMYDEEFLVYDKDTYLE